MVFIPHWSPDSWGFVMPQEFGKYVFSVHLGVVLFAMEILVFIMFVVHAYMMISTIGKEPIQADDDELALVSRPHESPTAPTEAWGPAEPSEPSESYEFKATQRTVAVHEEAQTTQATVAESEEPKKIKQLLPKLSQAKTT